MSFEPSWGEPIVIPCCRVQYCCLLEPDTGDEFSTGKFGLWALFPKDDEKTMLMILNALAEVGGVQSFKQLKKHPFLNQTKAFRDGDDQNQNPNGKDKARIGHYFCRISTNKHFDTFVLSDGDVIPCNPGEIYDGCYCAIMCTPSQYREGETTLYLNAVTKVRDGQRLASRVDPLQTMKQWVGVAMAQGVDTEVESVGGNFRSEAAVGTEQVTGQIAGAVPASGGMPDFGAQAVEETATRPKRGRPSAADKAAQATEAAPPKPNGRGNLSDIM